MVIPMKERLLMLHKYMLPHLDLTTFHSPEQQVLHSLNLRYFHEPCKATGRGPSTVSGINNTHGLSNPKAKTLPTVLHVDTYSHHNWDSLIGKRQCTKMVDLKYMKSQRVMSMPCLHGVSTRRQY
ncbi:unnamed protein product [Arctogadus glacialis]